MNSNRPLFASLGGVLGTTAIAAILLSQVGNDSGFLIDAVFMLDVFVLGVFFTLSAQQIATNDTLPGLLHRMNQQTPEISGNRVNASQMTQGRYPWETN